MFELPSSFRTKEKRIPKKTVSKNNKYCEVVMPNEENEILKYCDGYDLIKLLFVIYAGFETIPSNICACITNPRSILHSRNKQTYNRVMARI